MLDDLGVVDELLARGTTHLPVRFYDHARVVADLDLSADRGPPGVPYPGLLLLPQWAVEDVLLGRLARFGGSVERGRRLVALDDDGRQVTATVESDAGRETIRVAYLVGCDGGRSTTRKLLGLAFTRPGASSACRRARSRSS